MLYSLKDVRYVKLVNPELFSWVTAALDRSELGDVRNGGTRRQPEKRQYRDRALDLCLTRT